ncbi:MAG: methylenetetrahydrofolate reductase [NAD(P)H] [Nitrospira sp.]|nr:methylenetetrahydrofolate reductase [NAD(P)H] [Nitrospira sp.]
MKIGQLLKDGKQIFSFEFFPPKTDEGEVKLFETIENLRELGPSFVSVTYGAGGSTRDKTVDWVIRIKKDLGIEAMAHLTCYGTTAHNLGYILDKLQDNGIENILALRGDIPKLDSSGDTFPMSFNHANELVQFIKENYEFSIGAAAFPEGHMESPSLEFDTKYLKLKDSSGADFFVTQLFFNNSYYFDLVSRASKAGIDKPIIPGIMPITSADQIDRFTSLCGTIVPDDLKNKIYKMKDDSKAVMKLGIDYATEQCVELLSKGVQGIHFYTLNRSLATRTILQNLITR